MPVKLRVTSGTVADCTQAAALIDGIPLDAASAEYLLTNRGYDTNRALAAARERRDDAGDTAAAEPEDGA